MGVSSDDGTHELYLASVVRGGRGASYRGLGADAQVEITHTSDGFELSPWQQWRCPVGEVMRFAVMCDCAGPDASKRSRSTVLERWDRVLDPRDEDLQGGRLYLAPGGTAMDASERLDVQTAMRRCWAEHLAPLEKTVQLQAAWTRHRQALAAVEDAVHAARTAGLSWVDVGRATGMTRQSARERWGTS
ncbi:MAG: hypothetical protein ACRYF3_13545 [Janthinobacterium lividum]